MRLHRIRFLAVGVVAVTSLPALAGSNFDGFYLGGQIGVSAMQAGAEDTFSPPGLRPVKQSVDAGATGFQGGGYLGYGRTFGKWYAGLEAEVGAGTAEAEYNCTDEDPTGGGCSLGVDSQNISVSEGFTTGVALRGGYEVVPNALLYGRVGWQGTDFEAKTRGVSGGVDVARGSQSEFASGLRIGAGAEMAVMPNVLVRLDYNYTFYQSFDVGVALPVVGPLGATEKLRIEPGGHTFRVGVAYRF